MGTSIGVGLGLGGVVPPWSNFSSSKKIRLEFSVGEMVGVEEEPVGRGIDGGGGYKNFF